MITEIKHIILNLQINIVKIEFATSTKFGEFENKSDTFVISANGFLYGNGNKNLTKQLIITN